MLLAVCFLAYSTPSSAKQRRTCFRFLAKRRRVFHQGLTRCEPENTADGRKLCRFAPEPMGKSCTGGPLPSLSSVLDSRAGLRNETRRPLLSGQLRILGLHVRTVVSMPSRAAKSTEARRWDLAPSFAALRWTGSACVAQPSASPATALRFADFRFTTSVQRLGRMFSPASRVLHPSASGRVPWTCHRKKKR